MMRLHTISRVEALGTVAVVVLLLALVATSIGRTTLAWFHFQSTELIKHGIHLPFPLDRLDPTCPQCM